jgi:hypothetical protein
MVFQELLRRLSACTTSSLLAASGQRDAATLPLPASCLAALERAWPRAAAALLLQLAQADSGYSSRKYFVNPLAECQYQDLHVDTTAGGGATFASTSTQFYGATQVRDGGVWMLLSIPLHLPSNKVNRRIIFLGNMMAMLDGIVCKRLLSHKPVRSHHKVSGCNLLMHSC